MGMLQVTPTNLPLFATGNFSTPTMIDNTYLPFPFGITTNYVGETEDGEETVVVEVTGTTRVVAGVTCSVIRDRAYLDGIIKRTRTIGSPRTMPAMSGTWAKRSTTTTTMKTEP